MVSFPKITLTWAVKRILPRTDIFATSSCENLKKKWRNTINTRLSGHASYFQLWYIIYLLEYQESSEKDSSFPGRILEMLKWFHLCNGGLRGGSLRGVGRRNRRIRRQEMGRTKEARLSKSNNHIITTAGWSHACQERTNSAQKSRSILRDHFGWTLYIHA